MKTCKGCRALDGGWCSLGFINKNVGDLNKDHFLTLIPDEKCPKPKTYNLFLKLNNDK